MGSHGKQPSTIKIKHTYTGNKLNVLGTRQVNIDYQGQHYKFSVTVVAGKGPA